MEINKVKSPLETKPSDGRQCSTHGKVTDHVTGMTHQLGGDFTEGEEA